MIKELTPLQALKTIILGTNIDTYRSSVEEIDNDIAIIETALKSYEKLKECYKNELKNTAYYNNLALKYKKAVEIIKNKEVNVFIFLHSGDLETYNDMVEDNRKLTEEEYDFLKEILL